METRIFWVEYKHLNEKRKFKKLIKHIKAKIVLETCKVIDCGVYHITTISFDDKYIRNFDKYNLIEEAKYTKWDYLFKTM